MEQGDAMQQTAVGAKLEGAVSAPVALAFMLGLNTLVLLALDQAGAIPSWIKTAATLFLSF
jgi:hypothetical protein